MGIVECWGIGEQCGDGKAVREQKSGVETVERWRDESAKRKRWSGAGTEERHLCGDTVKNSL